MWVDKVLYWAWLGKGDCDGPPPTRKRTAYAEIKYDDVTMNIAATVFDDGRPTLVYRDEIEWHRKHGATVTLPD